MAGMGGGWWQTGSESAASVLVELHRALVRRGEGEGEVLWRNPVGMVSRAIEGDADAPPRIHRSGVVAVWDGRLDDRDALAASLGLDPTRIEDDLELILEAYARWGNETWGRLLGDWALALWDPRHECLYLARDPFGVRPLFVHARGDRVLWASTLGALRAAASPSDALDEAWLADYLASIIDAARTPYRELEAVRPGHVLRFHRGHRRQTRYWQPAPAAAPPSTDDRELERHFAAVLEQAVVRRLPARGAVGAELSGGLDSSSIACLAARALGETAATRLRPVSIVYRDSPLADERRHIQAVEEHLGLRAHRVWQEDFPALAGMHSPGYETPSIGECIKLREQAITQHLRSEGATTVLRGVGGDQVLCSEIEGSLGLADSLVHGRPRELLAGWRQAARSGRIPYLPLALDALRSALGPRWSGDLPGRVATWVHPRFARRVRERRDQFATTRARAEVRLPSLRMRLVELDDVIDVVSVAHDRGPRPLVVTYPFLDRTLVELCLSLPFEQLVRHGETRSIQRRALAGLVPAKVLGRRSKATMQDAFVLALRQQMPRLQPLLAELRVAELGLVEPRIFTAQLRRARYQGSVNVVPLLRVLALEHWLRARDSDRPRPLAHP